MGNIDSRGTFPNGNIQLQTDKKHYQPGDVIDGTVYLRITQAVPGAQRLELEVFGQEKA